MAEPDNRGPQGDDNALDTTGAPEVRPIDPHVIYGLMHKVIGELQSISESSKSVSVERDSKPLNTGSDGDGKGGDRAGSGGSGEPAGGRRGGAKGARARVESRTRVSMSPILAEIRKTSAYQRFSRRFDALGDDDKRRLLNESDNIKADTKGQPVEEYAKRIRELYSRNGFDKDESAAIATSLSTSREPTHDQAGFDRLAQGMISVAKGDKELCDALKKGKDVIERQRGWGGGRNGTESKGWWQNFRERGSYRMGNFFKNLVTPRQQGPIATGITTITRQLFGGGPFVTMFSRLMTGPLGVLSAMVAATIMVGKKIEKLSADANKERASRAAIGRQIMNVGGDFRTASKMMLGGRRYGISDSEMLSSITSVSRAQAMAAWGRGSITKSLGEFGISTFNANGTTKSIDELTTEISKLLKRDDYAEKATDDEATKKRKADNRTRLVAVANQEGIAGNYEYFRDFADRQRWGKNGQGTSESQEVAAAAAGESERQRRISGYTEAFKIRNEQAIKQDVASEEFLKQFYGGSKGLDVRKYFVETRAEDYGIRAEDEREIMEKMKRGDLLSGERMAFNKKYNNAADGKINGDVLTFNSQWAKAGRADLGKSHISNALASNRYLSMDEAVRKLQSRGYDVQYDALEKLQIDDIWKKSLQQQEDFVELVARSLGLPSDWNGKKNASASSVPQSQPLPGTGIDKGKVSGDGSNPIVLGESVAKAVSNAAPAVSVVRKSGEITRQTEKVATEAMVVKAAQAESAAASGNAYVSNARSFTPSAPEPAPAGGKQPVQVVVHVNGNTLNIGKGESMDGSVEMEKFQMLVCDAVLKAIG